MTETPEILKLTFSSEWIGRIRRAFRLVADRWPLTPRGLLLTAAASLALWLLGYGALDLLLFVLGIAGLALAVLACATAVVVGFLLRRRLAHQRRDRHRFETGSLLATGFTAPDLAWLPLIELDWAWLEPAGVEVRQRLHGGRREEEIVAHRRARTESVRRRFTVGDVFGLARFSWEAAEPSPLLILPDPGRLRQLPVVRSFASEEGLPHPSGDPQGDRMDIRRYVPGDSMRHVMWKVFARTRQLNVRIPERSVDFSRKTVAYLVAGEGDEPAAAAARVALESGALGSSWLFGADGTGEPTAELDEALLAIARSGSARNGSSGNGGHGGLGHFLEHARAQGEVNCIVFAPARAGAWSDAALAAGRSSAAQLSFVLGLDGVAQAEEPALWKRLLLRPETTPEIDREELNQLVRRLAGAGCPTLVVDRKSGRSFGDGRTNSRRLTS